MFNKLTKSQTETCYELVKNEQQTKIHSTTVQMATYTCSSVKTEMCHMGVKSFCGLEASSFVMTTEKH